MGQIVETRSGDPCVWYTDPGCQSLSLVSLSLHAVHVYVTSSFTITQLCVDFDQGNGKKKANNNGFLKIYFVVYFAALRNRKSSVTTC